MKGGFILLAICAFSCAMVPRERRAINLDELNETQATTTTSSTAAPQICAPSTPCAWTTYRPVTKMPLLHIVNSYCICSADLDCQISEEDTLSNTFVHRCRPPSNNSEENTSDQR